MADRLPSIGVTAESAGFAPPRVNPGDFTLRPSVC